MNNSKKMNESAKEQLMNMDNTGKFDSVPGGSGQAIDTPVKISNQDVQNPVTPVNSSTGTTGGYSVGNSTDTPVGDNNIKPTSDKPTGSDKIPTDNEGTVPTVNGDE